MVDKGQRIDCVDALRGLVMILMALDHTREYFGDLRLQPEDLSTTTPVLFFTRWVTHFCAPGFVFLAGTSAWLYGRKVNDKSKLAIFLFTRGLWLVVLEFTVVYFGWMQSFTIAPLMFIIIAAIGVSMLALSGLIYLRYRVLVGLGIVILAGHNLLDGIQASDLGALRPLWILVHEPGYIPTLHLSVGYPVLAWTGVIVCGYVFGAVVEQEQAQRMKSCLVIGGLCCIAFVASRWTNFYGDPQPWSTQQSPAFTAMSFLNCTKYPPSLLYLLMTLGPSLLVLAALDRINGLVSKTLSVFGRVPLFYYIAHLYLIHTSSRLFYWVLRGEPLSSLQIAFTYGGSEEPWPDNYGFDLTVVYIAWLVMLCLLFPLCWWFGKLKRRGRSALWSYL